MKSRKRQLPHGCPTRRLSLPYSALKLQGDDLRGNFVWAVEHWLPIRESWSVNPTILIDVSNSYLQISACF